MKKKTAITLIRATACLLAIWVLMFIFTFINKPEDKATAESATKVIDVNNLNEGR